MAISPGFREGGLMDGSLSPTCPNSMDRVRKEMKEQQIIKLLQLCSLLTFQH